MWCNLCMFRAAAQGYTHMAPSKQPLTGKVIDPTGFTVPHPAEQFTGERMLMCAACGGISKHTVRCAAVRADNAKLVGSSEGGAA